MKAQTIRRAAGIVTAFGLTAVGITASHGSVEAAGAGQPVRIVHTMGRSDGSYSTGSVQVFGRGVGGLGGYNTGSVHRFGRGDGSVGTGSVHPNHRAPASAVLQSRTR